MPGVRGTGDDNGATGDYMPISIARLRAKAPYIPLPHSKLANDGNAGTVTVSKGSFTEIIGAEVPYPTSGVVLEWEANLVNADAGDPAGPVIDGVHTFFFAKGAPPITHPAYRKLYLQVLPDWGLRLGGAAESDLISVARTLSIDAASPDAPLPPADPSTPPGDTFPGRVAYWWEKMRDALDNAMSADSVAAAGSLAFQPVAPSALGNPASILHTDPASAPASDRVLSLRYDNPSMGRFWLLERPSLSTTTSLLRTAVYECPSIMQECGTTASMREIGGGVSALSMLDGERPRIVWVEDGTYFEVIGQDAFSAGDALSVAKTVAAAASR